MSGIIYKITCNVTGYIYIGSTSKELWERVETHLQCYKLWKRTGSDFTTSFICLVNGNFTAERVCEVKGNLLKAEYDEMRKYDKSQLVNVNIKYGTCSDKARMKRYNSKKIECRCGAVLTRGNMARHRKTLKHKDYVELEKVCDTFENTKLDPN